MHCGQLILRKMSKIGATRYQILRLKCTKFDFCWGSVPVPDRQLYLRGLILRVGRRKGKGKEKGGKGEGRERDKRGDGKSCI